MLGENTTGTSESAVVNNVNGPYITVNGDYNVKQNNEEIKGMLFLLQAYYLCSLH